MERAGIFKTHSPGEVLKAIMRAPVCLYRMRLGWLLGHRVMMLTHTGRKSGLPRHTVLEVIRYDKPTGTCVAASGWGDRASWFRNIQENPLVIVDIGARRIDSFAVLLSANDAERELLSYAQRHRLSFRILARVLGEKAGKDGREKIREIARRGSELMPMGAFVPRVNKEAPPANREQGVA